MCVHYCAESSAEDKSSLPVMRLLLEAGADCFATRYDGVDVLMLAASSGDVVSTYKEDYVQNPVHTSSHACGVLQELVRLLLSEGVDPNAAVEATGWHALLSAVEGGGKQLERRGDMQAAVRSPCCTPTPLR